MSNLIGVYQKIDKSQLDFTVSYVKPFSYIQALTNNPQKCIIAYQQVAPTASPFSKPVKLLEDSPVSKLDLTGTPLEDDCQIDLIDDFLDLDLVARNAWKDEESLCLPIPIDAARKLLNSINLDRDIDCSSGSVWALCQSSDEPNTLLLQTEFSKSGPTSGIVKFAGYTEYTNIDMAMLVERHFTYIKNTDKIDTHIEVFFDIQPFLTMKLSWNTTSLAPTLASYRKSDILLYQTVSMGYNTSVADEFWQQLVLLDKIKGNIVEYNNDNKKSFLVYLPDDLCTLKFNQIEEKILKILSDVLPFRATDDRNESIDLEPVILRASKRDLVDITDQLWMLLRHCGSYDELKAAFDYIFKCSACCNVVNMPANKNHLAELIREIAQHRLAVPCLTGTEPLELLLEIGLEKAAKDYEFMFTESKTCSAKDLMATATNRLDNSSAAHIKIRQTLCNAAVTKVVETQSGRPPAHGRQTLVSRKPAQSNVNVEPIGFQNSSFVQQNVEQRLGRLMQIHVLMEHLLLIQINLKWSDMQDYVLEELKKPTAAFASVQSTQQDRREIPILCDKVIAKVESRNPNAQMIVMTSENKFRKVTNTHYYSINPILPPNAFPSTQSDDKDAAKTIFYRSLHYLKICSKRN